MFILFGYLIVFLSVFGSYVGLGGHLGALYQPFEFVLIAGAALGSFIAATNGASIRLLLDAVPKAIRRNPYGKSLYMELMALLYTLLNKARRDGLMAIESDIEDPKSSAIFTQYPQVARDPRLMEFLTDYLRIMVSGNMNSFEIETLMDQEIEAAHSEHHNPVNAVRAVADALPAFGIVAAVLGVVKALAAVDQPPAILADLISKAMVGTFLGILLSYGFVGPFAAAVERQSVASIKVLECIKVTLLASMNGYPPPLAVEFGRKVLFSSVRPTFTELEAHVRQSKAQGAR
ncbi:MAG: flagellar motor stator protein MotA [Alcaligenaceae bacterium]|nr:flagellar motor stator protein MotA [Alcaligenaceae bacterium]